MAGCLELKFIHSAGFSKLWVDLNGLRFRDQTRGISGSTIFPLQWASTLSNLAASSIATVLAAAHLETARAIFYSPAQVELRFQRLQRWKISSPAIQVGACRSRRTHWSETLPFETYTIFP